MCILVLGINYTPERTSVAPFTTGLCEHLAAQGHVTLVTAFPYYPECEYGMTTEATSVQKKL